MNDFRTTVLEERLGAMRTLTGVLIAHLEDNGLIDRTVLQADLAALLESVEQPDLVASDVRHTFQIADLLLQGYEQDRIRNLG